MRSVSVLLPVVVDSAFETRWHQTHTEQLSPLCLLCRGDVRQPDPGYVPLAAGSARGGVED